MRVILFVFTILCIPCLAIADTVLASAAYVTELVNNKTETKVDTSATANQTMAGTYTITGTLHVPTPPLPSAE